LNPGSESHDVGEAGRKVLEEKLKAENGKVKKRLAQ
jgi:hypothetical protein